MPKSPSQTGFQPRTTPAERRADFDRLRVTSTLEARIASLESQVAALETTVADHEARIAALEP